MRPASAAFATVLMALAASPSLLPAVEPNLYLSPALWHVGLTGDGKTGRGASDERFDVDHDLGLDTSTTNRTFESFLRFSRSSIIFGFSHGSYHGSNTLDSDLTFKGTLFPAGTRVQSDLNFDHRKLLYGMPFIESKVISGGMRIGLYQYRIGSEVSQGGTGSPNVDLKSTVPVIGANLNFTPTLKLRIHGEALVTSLDRGGVRSHIREAYAAVDYIFLVQTFGITVGRRYSDVSAEDKGRAKFDLRENGNFFGIFVQL